MEPFVSQLRENGFQGDIFRPHDADYESYHHRFISRLEVQPPCIIVPADSDDVSVAIRSAGTYRIELAVQCGGNNGSLQSVTTNGVLMHLDKLRGVQVDLEGRTVTFGGGCRWGEVYEALSGTGLEAVGASLGVVGVGGFLTMGGYSCWSGMYGMGCDNVLEAEVVTGEGEKLVANKDQHADLFWGIRGGLTNLGIVTRFTCAVHKKTGDIHFGNLVFLGHQAPELLLTVNDFVAKQTGQQVCIMTFATPVMVGQPCVVLTFWVYGTRDQFDATIAPFIAKCSPIVRNIPSVKDQSDFSELGAVVFNVPGKPRRHAHRIRVVQDFKLDVAQKLWEAYTRLTAEKRWAWSYATYELHHLNVLDENGADSAWRYHHKHMYSLLDVIYNDAEDDEDAEKVASALQSSLEEAHKAAFDGAPTKTWTSWSSGEVSLKETWGSTLPKLSTLKAKYDPENVLARGCSVAGPVSK